MTRLAFTAAIAAGLLIAALPETAHAQASSKDSQVRTAPDVATFDKHMAEAHAQFKRMQERMDALRQTQDPQERHRLMQEHWTSMQSAMTSMQGMWGPGMMGCCAAGSGMGPGMGPGMMMGHGAGWGMQRQHYSKLTPEQMKQRQYMMDQYMGMQQMMMDHMMLRQQWMTPPAAK